MFNMYLKQFTCKEASNATHLSIINGKFNIPKDKFEIFYRKYYDSLITNSESFYLIEKINKLQSFRFCLDIESSKHSDFELTDSYVAKIIKDIQSNTDHKEFIVSKRLDRYHVTFYNLICNKESAMKLLECVDYADSVIDKSIYNTGLRMVGSAKVRGKTTNDDIYRVYNLENGTFTEMSLLSFTDFTNTCILYNVKQSSGSENGNEDGISCSEDGLKLFNKLKKLNSVIIGDSEYIGIKKINNGNVIITSTLKVCPFINREHTRETNPVYILQTKNLTCVKCYDIDCSKKMVKLITDEPKIVSIEEKDCVGGEEMYDLLKESLSGTHYDIAMVIFSKYKELYRADSIKGTMWYKFDGVRWKITDELNVIISRDICDLYNRFLQIYDEKNKTCIESVITNLKNISFKNNIMTQLTYLFLEYDPKFYEKLDTNEKLIGFENGVYDFEKCEFRAGLPTDYLTFTTGYDYIEYNSDNKEIDEIMYSLKQILPSNDILHYVLTVISKALCACIDEKFYMWTGISGANGKSTMINFLENTLGDYITSIDVGLLTTKRGNPSNASPDIFRLKGKRIFSFQEPEHNDKIKTGILKQYTGGDTIIARDLFKSCISFKLQGTMIMCCNDLPIIESSDGGTWRRLRVTEFNSRFCTNPVKENEYIIDPNLKVKLKKWKQTFMTILIEKYKEYKVNGLEEPKDVSRATNSYKNDSDNFSDFLDKFYIEDSGDFNSINEVYNKFTIWSLENFPNAKVLEIKNLKKALKVRYGREKIVDRAKGYNIRFTE